MINVGIIGAGFFGEKHAVAIIESPDLQLLAASKPNQAALNTFTQKFGGRGYTQYQDLLRDSTVDVVVIATPHHLHTDIAVAAAEAGKHILLEKPMAPNPVECYQILQAVDKAGVKLMVGHINQFAPSNKMAKELITSGEVGEVVLGISTMSKFWMEENRRPWHLDLVTGGGMWFTAGMYCLDRLIWLVNSPIHSVCAHFDTRFHNQKQTTLG